MPLKTYIDGVACSKRETTKQSNFWTACSNSENIPEMKQAKQGDVAGVCPKYVTILLAIFYKICFSFYVDASSPSDFKCHP